VIGQLNQLTDLVETTVSDEIDVAAFASVHGTTEYHLRRMFSSLAGMPLSEYVRRRRMTLAASDVIGDEPLLDIAVRYGYGSTEAFGRAFRAVHGVTPAEVRRGGAPFLSQPQIRFHLTVEGNHLMDTRIVERPAFRLIGHAARVPLLHRGANPHIQNHLASLPPSAHERLKELSSTEPAGILQVTDDVDPDAVEGTELTYLHGVAIDAGDDVPGDLDTIEVTEGTWVVFRSAGPYPVTLQQTWAATATDWFPSNPWQLRPGPSIVAVIDRADDFSSATTELWMPVEPAGVV
jgi:AraC family transcriptional regulator